MTSDHWFFSTFYCIFNLWPLFEFCLFFPNKQEWPRVCKPFSNFSSNDHLCLRMGDRFVYFFFNICMSPAFSFHTGHFLVNASHLNYPLSFGFASLHFIVWLELYVDTLGCFSLVPRHVTTFLFFPCLRIPFSDNAFYFCCLPSYICHFAICAFFPPVFLLIFHDAFTEGPSRFHGMTNDENTDDENAVPTQEGRWRKTKTLLTTALVPNDTWCPCIKKPGHRRYQVYKKHERGQHL